MKLQEKKKRKHENISTAATSKITTTIAAVKSDEFDMYGSNDDMDWDKIEEEVRLSWKMVLKKTCDSSILAG